MSDVNTPTESAMAKAISKGFSVIESDASTLLLDIDTETDYEWFKEMLEIVNNTMPDLGAKIVDEWLSKSKNHHVRVALSEEISLTERLLLQAVLGSDRKRELLAYVRVHKGVDVKNVSILFKPPASDGAVA